MSTFLVFVLTVAIAGAATWAVSRRENAMLPKPTPCSDALAEVFGPGSGNTADSVLLTRLLTHRDRCIDNAEYVDQARRLMANAGKVADARHLLEDADRRHAFPPDELAAQRAWLDLAEASSAWNDGNVPAATAANARAVAAADSLRERWPEWSVPYRILQEARSVSYPQAVTPADDYYQLEDRVRGRFATGAYARSVGDTQLLILVFALSVCVVLGILAAVSGIIDLREIQRMPTSAIATAAPGYVELKGTLQPVAPGATVTGPFTHRTGVWYELESYSGFRRSTVRHEGSAQPFVLRDATGDVIIDPKGLTVRTTHLSSSLGSAWGITTSSMRRTERMLLEGDAAFVQGELYDVQRGEVAERHVRVAQNGKRLFVSTYTEAQLIAMERVWLFAGLALCAVAAALLAWGWVQRYNVTTVPGTLL